MPEAGVPQSVVEPIRAGRRGPIHDTRLGQVRSVLEAGALRRADSPAVLRERESHRGVARQVLRLGSEALRGETGRGPGRDPRARGAAGGGAGRGVGLRIHQILPIPPVPGRGASAGLGTGLDLCVREGAASALGRRRGRAPGVGRSRALPEHRTGRARGGVRGPGPPGDARTCGRVVEGRRVDLQRRRRQGLVPRSPDRIPDGRAEPFGTCDVRERRLRDRRLRSAAGRPRLLARRPSHVRRPPAPFPPLARKRSCVAAASHPA